ncbi:MAG: GGDEF domain-containing protein [Eubacterium sp.]|nr:GGDEF domain-containing protein [Eubacterium sp.]
MTYSDQRQNKIRYIVGAIMALFWVVYAVSTLLKADIVYNLSSPVISFTAAFLMYISRENMGKYWYAAKWVMIGIFIWFIADLFWILEQYMLPENEVISIISDNLYLIPDYFYIGGLVSYLKISFRRNDFQVVLVDTFVLTTIAFVIFQRWLQNRNPDYRINFETVNTLLYFFATIFLLILIVVILIKTGIKGHTLPFYFFLGAMSFHNVFEIRFTLKLLLGSESEDAYIDILYMLFIMIYSASLSYGKLKDIDREMVSQVDNADSYLHRRFRAIYWINAILILATAAILYIVGFFKEQDVFFVFAITMGYVIMCKTVQTNVLSEELLLQQKNENERLEQMVEEKTRELREMNLHLEKISNTDVLTGLFNRRYGIGYVEELVKQAENYPIAVYSLDLNYFKPINDNYGHEMGDVVLKEVGHRLNHLGQDRLTAIRVGGDEFLVIFRNASTSAAVENVGRLICERMDEPIEAHVISGEKGEQEQTFRISASIGVALYPMDTMDLDILFRKADQALYAIKHTHEKSAFLLYSEMEKRNAKEKAE